MLLFYEVLVLENVNLHLNANKGGKPGAVLKSPKSRIAALGNLCSHSWIVAITYNVVIQDIGLIERASEGKGSTTFACSLRAHSLHLSKWVLNTMMSCLCSFRVSFTYLK